MNNSFSIIQEKIFGKEKNFFGTSKEDKFRKSYEKKYGFYVKFQKTMKDLAEKQYKDNGEANEKLIEDITDKWLELRKEYGYPIATEWLIFLFKDRIREGIIGNIESNMSEQHIKEQLTKEQIDMIESDEFQDDEMEYFRLSQWDEFDLAKLALGHHNMRNEKCCGLMFNCLCASCASCTAFKDKMFIFDDRYGFKNFNDIK